MEVGTLCFEEAWGKHIDSLYGGVAAHWIDLDSLIMIKSSINDSRHQEDARVLLEVKKRRQ